MNHINDSGGSAFMLILDGAPQQPQPGSTDTKLQFLVAHAQKKSKPKHVSWWLCLSRPAALPAPYRTLLSRLNKEKQAPIIVTIISMTISFTLHDSCLSWGGLLLWLQRITAIGTPAWWCVTQSKVTLSAVGIESQSTLIMTFCTTSSCSLSLPLRARPIW